MAEALTVAEIVKRAGGGAVVARALHLHRSAPQKWLSVPPTYVSAISRLSGLPAHQIRPDVFDPPAADAQAEQPPAEAA